jgi:flagellar protein FliL
MNSKLIIGAAALLAAGGGAFYLHTAVAVKQANKLSNAEPSEPPPKLAFVDAKELTLRLSDASAEHYIKITPVLAVRAKSADEINDRIAVVRDRIVTIVTARSSTELETPQGQATLKRDVAAALKDQFHDQIVDIYFSAYLVE